MKLRRELPLFTLVFLAALTAHAGLMNEALLTAQDAIIADFHSTGRDVLDVTGCDLVSTSVPGATFAVNCYAEGQIGQTDKYGTHSCVVEMTRINRSIEVVSTECSPLKGE